MSFEFAIAAVAWVVILVLEGLYPYMPGRQKRLRHAGRNLGVAAINGTIHFGFGVLTVGLLAWTRRHNFGLLYLISQHEGIRMLAGFILFDIWMYWWHRINHERSFLWRFHRMHHTDVKMDSTTAMRFHPVEMFFFSLFNMAVLALLGLQVLHLAVYQAVFFPVFLFHHSNIALPTWYDTALRAFIVTPNMHRVHHSRHIFETNSNYARLFSFWDRLFRTYRKRENPREIIFGLEHFREPKWQSLKGMLITPLHSSRPIG